MGISIDFSDRTVLVTGASRGIGRQIALDLAQCGATLIVTSTGKHLDATLQRDLGPHRHVTVDFTNSDSTQQFLETIRGLSELHVCINNAGLTRHGPSEQTTLADWDLTNDVNLKAPFFVSQAAAEVMKRHAYGRIVNISSIWGHMTMANRSVYTATKFGLRGLTLAYAVELAAHNILVNVVSPGFTMTDMVRKNYSKEHLSQLTTRIPIGRLADCQDISRAVLFLASDLNSYITGQGLVVDGGYSVT